MSNTSQDFAKLFGSGRDQVLVLKHRNENKEPMVRFVFRTDTGLMHFDLLYDTQEQASELWRRADESLARCFLRAARGDSGHRPVMLEVETECERQDVKWGGPKHDDQDTLAEWAQHIRTRLDGNKDHFRQHMIEIAALAIAAVESFDRQYHS